MILKEITMEPLVPFDHLDPYNKRVIDIAQQSIPLCELYLKLLGKYKTSSTAKIVICMTKTEVNEMNGFKIIKKKAKVLMDIVEYCINFDFDHYDQKTILEQRTFYWKTLCECILDIAIQLNWERTAIEKIFQMGMENGVQEYK